MTAQEILSYLKTFANPLPQILSKSGYAPTITVSATIPSSFGGSTINKSLTTEGELGA